MARRKPPLYAVHDDRGATFTGFGGWDMPVEFDSIQEEHAAVRERAGIFDVSHMGEIEVSGPDATTLMQRLTTNDVTTLEAGDSQYSAITDEDGVMLDDTIVYRLPAGTRAGEVTSKLAELAGSDAGSVDEPDGDAGDGESYLFIPNAGHDEETYDRWVDYRDEHDLEADVVNATTEWAMVAVQGSDASQMVADASSAPTAAAQTSADMSVRDLAKSEATATEIADVPSWVARTGYTGEDGFEILCPADDAETVWNAFDCQPCGLGARDTLRIEMGFLLSGQDFDPETEPRTPYEANVGFVVKLDTDFVGRDALAAQSEAGVEERFTGVKLTERGVARSGYPITDGDGTEIGHVTSGTMSPTLGEPVALGYLPADVEDGDEVAVEVRGTEKRAQVVTPPFVTKP